MGICEQPAGRVPGRARRASSASTPPRRPRPRHGRRRIQRHARRAGARSSSRWAATSSRPRPDTERHRRRRCARCRLTVHVSTKLNRSHLVTGDAGADPAAASAAPSATCRPAGAQFVTVEDSMGVVHASRGRAAPRPPSTCCSEVGDRLPGWRGRVLGDAHAASTGRSSAADYDRIRDAHRARRPRLRGLQRAACAQPGGFVLPHPPRDARAFPTADRQGAASPSTRSSRARGPAGRLLLQTIRSHDQYNTTIYGLDDRYRGIHGGRRVVFMHPDDLAELGPRRRRRRRPRQRVRATASSAAAPALPRRRLPDRRAAAPPPTSPRPTSLVPLDRTADGQQHADVEVDRRATRTPGRGRPARRLSNGPAKTPASRRISRNPLSNG